MIAPDLDSGVRDYTYPESGEWISISVGDDLLSSLPRAERVL